MSAPRYFAILLFLVLATMPLERSGLVARADAETVKDMPAAQVRSQGIACDKPRQNNAGRKGSKPDHDVWIPDMRKTRLAGSAAIPILQRRS